MARQGEACIIIHGLHQLCVLAHSLVSMRSMTQEITVKTHRKDILSINIQTERKSCSLPFRHHDCH